MQAQNDSSSNVLDGSNPDFPGLCGVRDNIASNLRCLGIGAVVKHTEIITVVYKKNHYFGLREYWEWQIPSHCSMPSFLQQEKFYVCVVVVRHHALKLSQFNVSSDSIETDFVLYVENGLTNRSGSYKDKEENKILKQ